MKKYITYFTVVISLGACIPPGKLSESLDANSKLSSRYDSLNNKLKDTLTTFSNSLSSLKENINTLKDSVTYYRGLVAATPAQTQGDVFLNQILGYSLLSTSELAGIKAANISNNANNAWLESFKADVKKYQDAFNTKAKEIGSKAYIKPDSAFGEQTASARIVQAKQQTPPADTIETADVYEPEAATTTTEETTKTNWWDTASTALNAILPSIRPSDAEGLDTAQLYPEMFAMSNNQVSPVQAQTFQPDLGVPYDISYQDQLNANQADYRAAQRMMGYNPAAQANLNAQKYQANQSVLADQFRANQGMKDKVYGENRNMLNQAKLTNLGIFDKQYERQTEALANTKATTQAALNSISDKYAKNKLENRELKTYENMYNYRFGPNFRAQNMNPFAQWDTDYKGASSEELDAMSAYKKALAKREAAEEKKKKPSLAGESIAKRNGSIVKSYKNI